MRRVIKRVVIENDVHLLRFLREVLCAIHDFANFFVAVIVIEPGRDSFSGRVSVRIAPVQSEISELWVRDRVELRRHNCEMLF